ncbi:hypothetical protein ACLVWU_17500 [Bdellovibrio sp. HCB290]|uniref:hypothetical protein n=1 Tax=Bdellovibrio sp. HCB290 TaxID=3394356 RepID=UPI0039B54131
MKKIVLMSLIILSTGGAYAFDRISCDSDLDKWTVHTSLNSKKALINAKEPNAYLDRQSSLMLVVRDEKKVNLAVVSPWNKIQMFKTKKSQKTNYKFDFKTDSETNFTLSITDPKTAKAHSLSCKLTF